MGADIVRIVARFGGIETVGRRDRRVGIVAGAVVGIIGDRAPAHNGSVSAAVTKSYPSDVRLPASAGWSNRVPSSTSATSTDGLPVVMVQARGKSIRP